MNLTSKIISLDRENMSETDINMYLSDMKKLNEEYFESDGEATLEVTKTENGFLVCVLFTARRIKSVKTPA